MQNKDYSTLVDYNRPLDLKELKEKQEREMKRYVHDGLIELRSRKFIFNRMTLTEILEILSKE